MSPDDFGDDPFASPDLSRSRPRPGAGKRGGGSEQTRVGPIDYDTPDSLPNAAQALMGTGLNPLVKAACPALILAGQLRSTRQHADASGLRRQAVDGIRRFEERGRAARLDERQISAARYVICSALDEAALSTPWGHESEWAERPLLAEIHREAWGGDTFFEVLEGVSRDPARHIDFMELQCVCLALGFVGKYGTQEKGRERLAEITRDLHRRIQLQRGHPSQELSLKWRGLEDRRNPLVQLVPWWMVVAGAAAVLALIFSLYSAWLGSTASPIHARLAQVGLEAFSVADAAPATGPTLKQLLKPEEERQVLTVEEQGGRTVVTLLASELFASGSASINTGFEGGLTAVAQALNKVPGRVLVEGHTDDQPIHSFRFQDNFELSRERAKSVVDVLQRTIDSRARLSVNGAGDTRPRYTPASVPENRARNRRVEIIHVRGA